MAPTEMIQTKIVIVGAGFGGLGMGVALKEDGEDDFVILEKYADIGGVWRDNTYPGCTCDVPSHLYSFSFAPYKSRNQRYPPQNEILADLQRVASNYKLRPHLSLQTEVLEAHFHDEEKTWEVVTVSKRFCAEIVIFAVGQLHEPKYPDIHGLEEFGKRKHVMHSARWNDNIDLRDKRIGVIGTGSSAAQMLPTLASASLDLAVYQRTPHWVLPKPDPTFGYISRSILRVPGTHGLYRTALHYCADILLSPLMRPGAWSRVVEYYAKYNLGRQIANKELVEKLTPKYPIGSKRILFDNHFYPTITRPDVRLETEPILSIHEGGIETRDGLFPADIIICATGFKASDFLVPISVRGRNGHLLNEDWKSGAEAFLGLAIRGYPNLFLIAGPNSFSPAGSNPEMKEFQIDYIMECLRWKKETHSRAIEVGQKAIAEYQEWLTGKLRRTVWSNPVNSWYKHKSGKVTNPWPASVRVFSRMLSYGPHCSFESV